MKIILVSLGLVCLIQGIYSAFTNPIVDHGPDPWMVNHNGQYYFIATTWSSQIKIRHAKTLAELHSAADTVVFNLTDSQGCCNMWAPELHLLNSTNGQRWYLYFTAGQKVSDYIPTQRIHVLESSGTDPLGPYTLKGNFRDTSDDSSFELDPSILEHDGKLYLMGTYVRSGQDLFIRPLSNPWTASGPKVRLSTPSQSWETQGGSVQEGPEPLYHGGKTMIVYSASYCATANYKLGLLTLTGTDPLNPAHWTKSGPIFQRSDANHVYGPGHNGFFKSPDGKEDWIVYHANSAESGGCDMNRSARAQKFTWNSDNTPNFGTPHATGASETSPSGE